jgi:hypothetical protein
MLCGQPGEGIHSVRFMGLALVDMLATMGGALAVSRRWRLGFWRALAMLLCVGVATHRMLRINTALNVALLGVV